MILSLPTVPLTSSVVRDYMIVQEFDQTFSPTKSIVLISSVSFPFVEPVFEGGLGLTVRRSEYPVPARVQCSLCINLCVVPVYEVFLDRTVESVN